MPSMETLVASEVRQVSTTWSPAETADGVAVIWAVGAGAVAGGAVSAGMGGAAFFLWHPATVNMVTSRTTGTKTRLKCFNSYSFAGSSAEIRTTEHSNRSVCAAFNF